MSPSCSSASHMRCWNVIPRIADQTGQSFFAMMRDTGSRSALLPETTT
jgi:hypothetical protein